MLRSFYQILVIIALSGNIIWGQEAGGILSLSQALQTGLQNNLILQQERQRIQQGQAKLQMQKSAYFPRVSANGLYNHLTNFPDVNLPLGSALRGAEDINIYDFSFKLQQPIFTGFRVKNLVRSAGADLEYNESQYQSNLHLLVYQVANTYRAAQLNQLQQQVLQASLQRVENDLETTRNFYQAGQCSAFDTLTIANQYLNIQTELNEMVHQYQNILTQLEFLLNIKPVQGVENFSAPAADLQTEPLESYLQKALENRPELKQIKHQASSRTFFKKSIESSYWPQVYAQATFHYLKPEVEILKDEWTDFFILGLNLQWDLWDSGKRRNEIKQLSYTLNILNLEEEKISESIRSEVKQAYRNLLTDRDQITFTGKLVQQETERYRIAHEKYEQGLATATDLNNVQSALTAAELRQKQSQIKWWQDKALMDYATGQLITSE